MTSTDVPAYMRMNVMSEKTDGKSSPCPEHPTTLTPAIDAQVHRPENAAYLLRLSQILADLAHDETCTACAMDGLGQVMVAFSGDVKAAKKDGSWSREDKKALKGEMKVVGKVLKEVWKQGRGKKM